MQKRNKLPLETFESVSITPRNQVIMKYLVLTGHATTEGDLINEMISDYLTKHRKKLNDLESWKYLINKLDLISAEKMKELIE